MYVNTPVVGTRQGKPLNSSSAAEVLDFVCPDDLDLDIIHQSLDFFYILQALGYLACKLPGCKNIAMQINFVTESTKVCVIIYSIDTLIIALCYQNVSF